MSLSDRNLIWKHLIFMLLSFPNVGDVLAKKINFLDSVDLSCHHQRRFSDSVLVVFGTHADFAISVLWRVLNNVVILHRSIFLVNYSDYLHNALVEISCFVSLKAMPHLQQSTFLVSCFVPYDVYP